MPKQGIPGKSGPRGLPGPPGDPGYGYGHHQPHYDYVETSYVEPHHAEPPQYGYGHPHAAAGGPAIFLPGKLKRESQSSGGDQSIGASSPNSEWQHQQPAQQGTSEYVVTFGN